MRHWFLLTESAFAAHRHHHPLEAAIIAGRGGDPHDSLPPAQRTRMFWLGAVESIPLLAGGVIAAYSNTPVAAAGCAGGAILLTAIICWCLRHQTPDTRVELRAGGQVADIEGKAARETATERGVKEFQL